jgi:hypothetical protein
MEPSELVIEEMDDSEDVIELSPDVKLERPPKADVTELIMSFRPNIEAIPLGPPAKRFFTIPMCCMVELSSLRLAAAL